MADNGSVVLAGCGNMGFAMLQGWLASEALKTEDAFVVEPNEGLRDRAAGLGVTAVADATELPDDLVPAMIVLAVKPQVMDAVLPAYAGLAERGAAIVSVAAGIRIDRFEKAFGDKTAVIRVMPNTPAAVGAGMMVLCANAATSAGQLDFARTLMSASGATAVIEDEALMDAVTAVSGSGPAYLFHMIEALTDAAKKAGLPDDLAATREEYDARLDYELGVINDMGDTWRQPEEPVVVPSEPIPWGGWHIENPGRVWEQDHWVEQNIAHGQVG